VRALLSLESIHWAFSALFEYGLFSPSNRFFGSSAPVYYSSAGCFVPRIALSVFGTVSITFECGLSVPRTVSLGLQHHLYYFRVRAACPSNSFSRSSAPPKSFECRLLVPRSDLSIFSALFEYGLFSPSNRSFGPSAPYSSVDCLVPRIASSGIRCLHIIRVRALLSLESLHRASSALVLFKCGLLSPSNCSFGLSVPSYYSSAGVIVPRIAPSG
jgi:hypothetical protein